MKKAKIILALIVLLITTPIWFYLLYKILEAVNASELMWFLYWVYLPFSFIASVVYKIYDDKD